MKMRLNEKIPEFGIAKEWINTEPLTTETISGKPICVHFWSVSCKLCKKAMPSFVRIRDTYADTLQVISVHTPLSEDDMDLDLNEIRSVAAENDLTEPIAIDNEESLSKAFNIHFVPAYYLFDHSGKLRYIQRGKVNAKMLEKQIRRLIR